MKGSVNFLMVQKNYMSTSIHTQRERKQKSSWDRALAADEFRYMNFFVLFLQFLSLQFFYTCETIFKHGSNNKHYTSFD